jgi:hypothetical protein
MTFCITNSLLVRKKERLHEADIKREASENQARSKVSKYKQIRHHETHAGHAVQKSELVKSKTVVSERNNESRQN